MTVGLSAPNLVNAWLDGLDTLCDYLKLHTADPGVGATAAAAGDTTRKAITWAAASAGSKAMNGTLPVWTNGGSSETISHLSGWDASTAGNFALSAALTASQAWASGNTFTLDSLSVAITPIAA